MRPLVQASTMAMATAADSAIDETQQRHRGRARVHHFARLFLRLPIVHSVHSVSGNLRISSKLCATLVNIVFPVLIRKFLRRLNSGPWWDSWGNRTFPVLNRKFLKRQSPCVDSQVLEATEFGTFVGQLGEQNFPCVESQVLEATEFGTLEGQFSNWRIRAFSSWVHSSANYTETWRRTHGLVLRVRHRPRAGNERRHK